MQPLIAPGSFFVLRVIYLSEARFPEYKILYVKWQLGCSVSKCKPLAMCNSVGKYFCMLSRFSVKIVDFLHPLTFEWFFLIVKLLVSPCVMGLCIAQNLLL